MTTAPVCSMAAFMYLGRIRLEKLEVHEIGARTSLGFRIVQP
jgi:hypothetical protein